MKVAALVLIAFALAATGASGSREGVPRVKHVVLVVFENREAGEVIGNRHAPTFGRLAHAYVSLTRYTAVAHPSLPNYLALVSGSTHGVHDDCTSCSFGGRSLADTVEAAHLTWTTYAEGLPRPGYTGAESGSYAKKHVPFLYFRRVLSDATRRAQVVPFRQWRGDLRGGRLPSFSLVVPNLCHDMHDCSVAAGDRWLNAFVRPLLASPQMRDGVLFVVFDEGTSDAGGGGRVAALAAGPRVRAHVEIGRRANHYVLLRTIEDALRLPHLGKSARARPLTGIWR